MDHRLSTILKWMAANSLIQIDYLTTPAAMSQVDDEFYERRRIEFLNNFNNRDLIQIGREALATMAFNDIEPIEVPSAHYGEREAYQEVKAHLISPYSRRRSASSRSVDDNRISQRGDKPLVSDYGPDWVSYRHDVEKELAAAGSSTTSDGTPTYKGKLLNEWVEEQFTKDRIKEIATNYIWFTQSRIVYGIGKIILFHLILEEAYKLIKDNYMLTTKNKVYVLNIEADARFYYCSLKSYGCYYYSKELQKWEDSWIKYGWFISPLSAEELSAICNNIGEKVRLLLHEGF